MECNILFTCAGKRNYLLRYFKQALKGKGKIIAVDSHKYAAASADADFFVQVPNIYDDDYVSKLQRIIRDYKITALISLNDLELPILSRQKEDLEKLGVKVLVSNDSVIRTTFDKWQTHKFIKSIGLNSPKTYIDFNLALKDIEQGNLIFPIVLKPRFGSGSFGVEICEDIEELKLAYKLQNIKIKRSIFSRDSKADIMHSILIQEKLKGVEFGFDILNDFKGNFCDVLLREKLAMRFGETDKAISRINKPFEVLGEKIGNQLKHIGSMDGDAFLVGKEWFFLELNPRFGGGYPFSHEAGANIAAVYIDWLMGNVTNFKKYINYNADVVFSKYELLVKLKS